MFLRLYLVSSRAGGLGFNMIGATRMIIFDASWNSSQDVRFFKIISYGDQLLNLIFSFKVQSVFRIHRIGQKKETFIYRLVSAGTVEDAIYKRQVLKESNSKRIVDNCLMTQHYKNDETKISFEYVEPPLKTEYYLPNDDDLLYEILSEKTTSVLSYHTHDILTASYGQNTVQFDSIGDNDEYLDKNESQSNVSIKGSRKRPKNIQISKATERVCNVLKTNVTEILTPRPLRQRRKKTFSFINSN